jgi:hypothetical protein
MIATGDGIEQLSIFLDAEFRRYRIAVGVEHMGAAAQVADHVGEQGIAGGVGHRAVQQVVDVPDVAETRLGLLAEFL